MQVSNLAAHSQAPHQYFLELSVIYRIYITLCAFFSLMACVFMVFSYIVPMLVCVLIGSIYLCSMLFARAGSLNACISVLHINGFMYSCCGVLYFGLDYGFQYYSLHTLAFCYVGAFARIWHIYVLGVFAAMMQMFLYWLGNSQICYEFRLVLFNYDFDFIFYMLHFGSLAAMFGGVMLAMRSRLYANVIDKTLEHIQIIENDSTKAINCLLSRQELNEYLEGENFASSANLALVDIDHFKKINDFYGCSAGDEVIAACAQELQKHLSNAVISRWGGEEFLLLSQESNPDEFFDACKSFMQSFSERTFKPGFTSSCSIGCLCVRNEFRPYALDEYLQKLEKNLADAKSTGLSKIITTNF